MKNSRTHAMLSDIYRLLSDYAATDFLRASQYVAITPHLRDALRALAREAARFPSDAGSKEATAKRASLRTKRSRDERSGQKSDIVALVRRSSRFGSTHSINQFAKEVGLRIIPRPKESRERLAGRLADAILHTPEPRRSEMISQLVGGADSQTQGWIDVIKGSRP